MFLIVGLGNPDEQYKETRHNVGFMMLDFVARKTEANSFELESRLKALVTKSKIGKSPVVLAKSQTYVNKSGEAVKKLIENRKLKIENLVIVHDDLDIPFGYTKLSFEKDSAGHRGVDSIMRQLKTKKFWRLRIGTQSKSLITAKRKNPRKKDEIVRNFVLSKFTPNERKMLNKIYKQGLDKIETVFRH